MCGRFSLTASREELTGFFDLANCPDLQPRTDITPGSEIAVIGLNSKGLRTLGMMRWGLIPHWARAVPKYPTYNARVESAADKPSFRSSFAHRRCLIPASGWYEWQKENGRSIPWMIRGRDCPLLTFAGLWDRCQIDGKTILSTTILTRPAVEELARLHPRMPVLLAPGDFTDWLCPKTNLERINAIATQSPKPGFTLSRQDQVKRISD